MCISPLFIRLSDATKINPNANNAQFIRNMEFFGLTIILRKFQVCLFEGNE